MTTLRQGSGQVKKAQGTGDGGQRPAVPDDYEQDHRGTWMQRDVKRWRHNVHATVLGILEGRVSRDGPPFAALDDVLDKLVDYARSDAVLQLAAAQRRADESAAHKDV